jgi:hypothetical protein
MKQDRNHDGGSCLSIILQIQSTQPELEVQFKLRLPVPMLRVIGDLYFGFSGSSSMRLLLMAMSFDRGFKDDKQNPTGSRDNAQYPVPTLMKQHHQRQESSKIVENKYF